MRFSGREPNPDHATQTEVGVEKQLKGLTQCRYKRGMPEFF